MARSREPGPAVKGPPTAHLGRAWSRWIGFSPNNDRRDSGLLDRRAPRWRTPEQPASVKPGSSYRAGNYRPSANSPLAHPRKRPRPSYYSARSMAEGKLADAEASFRGWAWSEIAGRPGKLKPLRAPTVRPRCGQPFGGKQDRS